MINKSIIGIGGYSVLIILFFAIICANYNLLFAQNITSIKTVVNKIDTLGDVTHVYTKHGEFYVNDYDLDVKRKWSKNKITNFYNTISDSEKKKKYILIQYNKDREILDVTLVK